MNNITFGRIDRSAECFCRRRCRCRHHHAIHLQCRLCRRLFSLYSPVYSTLYILLNVKNGLLFIRLYVNRRFHLFIQPDIVSSFHGFFFSASLFYSFSFHISNYRLSQVDFKFLLRLRHLSGINVSFRLSLLFATSHSSLGVHFVLTSSPFAIIFHIFPIYVPIFISPLHFAYRIADER